MCACDERKGQRKSEQNIIVDLMDNFFFLNSRQDTPTCFKLDVTSMILFALVSVLKK